MTEIEQLEQQLDSFNADERRAALTSLIGKARAGQLETPPPGDFVNLHCHTFFSYNSYGYSPSKFAWLAKKAGIVYVGTTDFDVLDAADEFLEATRLLGLKGTAGMETRVFVPQFSARVMNSPGEPGISYHMGVGFPSGRLSGELRKFQQRLQDTAQERNRDLMSRVNAYLAPVELDYENDVLPLTPAGNATERHICAAYVRKSREIFEDETKLLEYWTEKLGTDVSALGPFEGKDFINTLRKKTMKKGGVGYVQPDSGSFPKMAEVDAFSMAAGAMPTLTWLDGTSDGEQCLEELINVGMSSGVVAFNVIPDRNYSAGLGESDVKLRNLYEAVETATKYDLVLVVGTEMNSPGQRFVDDFDTDELRPLLPKFLASAKVIYAHSVLQRQSRMGYCSKWAVRHLRDREERNDVYEQIGGAIDPGKEELAAELDDQMSVEEVLRKVNA